MYLSPRSTKQNNRRNNPNTNNKQPYTQQPLVHSKVLGDTIFIESTPNTIKPTSYTQQTKDRHQTRINNNT